MGRQPPVPHTYRDMPKSPKDLEANVIAELKELGARIKQLRDFRRLTLNAVAKSAGVGVQTLVRIEEGSPGVALLNLQKVLTVLDAPARLLPVGMPPTRTPTLPLHADSETVRSRVNRAAALACQELEKLARKDRENSSLSSEALIALVERRLMEALQGLPPAALAGPDLSVPALYSDEHVGGPRSVGGAKPAGWVLRLRDTRQILDAAAQNGQAGLDSLSAKDLFGSRADALSAVRAFVEARGHLPGAVDAVPVFKDGDALRF